MVNDACPLMLDVRVQGTEGSWLFVGVQVEFHSKTILEPRVSVIEPAL